MSTPARRWWSCTISIPPRKRLTLARRRPCPRHSTNSTSFSSAWDQAQRQNDAAGVHVGPIRDLLYSANGCALILSQTVSRREAQPGLAIVMSTFLQNNQVLAGAPASTVFERVPTADWLQSPSRVTRWPLHANKYVCDKPSWTKLQATTSSAGRPWSG